ncbi:MAG: hypothetical protein ACON4H_12325 [Rubripirellula sp.]
MAVSKYSAARNLLRKSAAGSPAKHAWKLDPETTSTVAVMNKPYGNLGRDEKNLSMESRR